MTVCALCLQYGDESSKTIMKFRESDYAGQYSPWSCETIGSYIGTKDAKPKDVMVSGAMEMMVSSDGDTTCNHVSVVCIICVGSVTEH